MPASDFPAYLTLADKDFAEQPDQAVYRTQVEGGLPKLLQKFSLTLVKRPVVYLAGTNADYQSFKTWVRATLKNGADWFNWTDPVDNVLKLARIENGAFKGSPWTPMLDKWEISMTIETWDS
jgi:hypothetical protein